MISTMKRKLITLAVGLLMLLLTPLTLAAPYGTGKYSACTYGEGCNISLSTSGTVDLDVLPTASGVVTIEKDEVTVTTNSSTGFELRLESSSGSENGLINGPNSIGAVSGTAVSPAVLGLNQWGYRVDGLSGFGAGPTGSIQNQPSSSLEFAGLPLLGSPQVIKTTASSAPSGDTTEVWYGVRADMDRPAGSYTATVVYTAIVL